MSNIFFYVVMTVRNGYQRCYVPTGFTSELRAEEEATEARRLVNAWDEKRYDKVWVEKWRLQ